MYAEDPALRYRIEGVPKATMPTGLSLPIGQDEESIRNIPVHWHHAREGSFTSAALPCTFRTTKSVFLDDPIQK